MTRRTFAKYFAVINDKFASNVNDRDQFENEDIVQNKIALLIETMFKEDIANLITIKSCANSNISIILLLY